MTITGSQDSGRFYPPQPSVGLSVFNHAGDGGFGATAAVQHLANLGRKQLRAEGFAQEIRAWVQHAVFDVVLLGVYWLVKRTRISGWLPAKLSESSRPFIASPPASVTSRWIGPSCSSQRRKASPTSAAASTLYPRRRRIFTASSRMICSSSTNSTVSVPDGMVLTGVLFGR